MRGSWSVPLSCRGGASQCRELVLDVSADLQDLRGGAVTLAPALDTDSYDEAQALAASLRAGCVIPGFGVGKPR